MRSLGRRRTRLHQREPTGRAEVRSSLVNGRRAQMISSDQRQHPQPHPISGERLVENKKAVRSGGREPVFTYSVSVAEVRELIDLAACATIERKRRARKGG